ncbi:MAG: carbamoyl-phosphate synthase large subunit [Actinomycetes bacterium]
MPRRDDIERIMILGSGPIVIGQAAEFDYSGTQACKVLREEGYEIVLVNSNPATIMTDPGFSDATYVEPLLPRNVARIIERERPDAILPTLGGQTALNLAKALHEDGTLERHGVELIGANYDAIHRAEDRDLFRETMNGIGLKMPLSAIAHNLEEARASLGKLGLPVIIRPAFTLGGRGGGVAHTEADFDRIVKQGVEASPIGQVLLDQSVIGWGEFEMEVMRDKADNVVIVCSVENLDPMGVHTGDSVCVAPQQTLTDPVYQQLRDQAIAVIRAVGVETGGSNVQFAVNPETEEILVIEMNPRVSRSSALASKATGFPIAKIAARLAVGYTLQEIPNDITLRTPASFEPVLDYVVVKWPRFAFEKFPGANAELTTHMKSVGEAMSMAGDFRQAFAKALRSRELDSVPDLPESQEDLLELIRVPGAARFDALLEGLRRGIPESTLHSVTSIDPWFLTELAAVARDEITDPGRVRTYRAVDTCAAEFEAATPYFYSSLERPGPDGDPVHETSIDDRESVVILGSGPNRIGQGIEFDYCCVHAAQAVRDSGRAAVMVNCNPETVSTDYDSSDRLYFEPLTLDDVAAVCEHERAAGVIVQFGGQTPLRLAAGLGQRGIKILGSGIDAIDLAEDRSRFGELLDRLGYAAPAYAAASDPEAALVAAEGVGYPLLVRPSYVLGGRAMEIVYDRESLADYLDRVGIASHGGGKEIFLDRFLENAIEIDVDALCDGKSTWVAGVMQHVEEAGIHSGDSACVLPPHSLSGDMLDRIKEMADGIAKALGVVGLLNVQFAVHNGEPFVIEANPRASRTVPFVSKAIGLPLARYACRLMLGETIEDLGLPASPPDGHVAVKEAVLPFDRFSGADALLGPEMRSTGEVMGVARDFPTAFAKAQAAAGAELPEGGTVFLSVKDADKPLAGALASQLHDLGFRIVATRGTAAAVSSMGIPAQVINKIPEGSPNVVDLIEAGEVGLVVNTPTGSGGRVDGWEIRTAAVRNGVPCVTTMAGGLAAARAIGAARQGAPEPISLQDLHAERESA